MTTARNYKFMYYDEAQWEDLQLPRLKDGAKKLMMRYVPEAEVGNCNLPEGNVVQITILWLRLVGLSEEIDCLEGLATTESKLSIAEYEEHA